MSDDKFTENTQSFKPIKDTYITGNPVTSKEMFFGRENDFRKIKDWVGSEGGQHIVLLIGGRRSGKTSILWQIKEGRLNAIGETVWCDFDKLTPVIHSDEDFVREIGKNILENPKFQGFESAFFNGFTADTAPERLQKLLKNCCQLIHPKKLLILCDEFDVVEELFEHKTLSKEALSWVKSALNSPVCFIMTSSHDYREELCSTTFGGNARTTTIAEFSEQDAYSLIEKPCPELNYHSETLKKIYRLSGGLPFYIQIICAGLIYHINNNLKRTDIKPDDLNEVIDFILANPHGHIQESWRSLFTSGIHSKTALHVFGALANTIQSPDEYADITAILKVAKKQKFDINEDSFIKATAKNARLLESINNKPRFRADIFRYWIAYNYQNGAMIDEYISTFQPKTPSELYSNAVKEILSLSAINSKERQSLDLCAKNLGLTNPEADEIENKIRKQLNKAEIDWVNEYKNSVNYVKNNDTLTNRGLLKSTYIKSNRISEKTAADINKRFNFSVLPKNTSYWLAASLLATTAVIAIPFSGLSESPLLQIFFPKGETEPVPPIPPVPPNPNGQVTVCNFPVPSDEPDAIDKSDPSKDNKKTNKFDDYTVKSGDSLSGIAKDKYGSFYAADSLYQCNKEHIEKDYKDQLGKAGLWNKNKLEQGWKLSLCQDIKETNECKLPPSLIKKSGDTIRLAFFGDLEGELFPNEKSDFGLGGVLCLDQLMRDANADLKLSVGDDINGSSPFGNIHEGKHIIDAYNIMGIDAMNIGSHEFDFDQEKNFLQDTLAKSAKFKFLTANVESSNAFQKYAEYSIKNKSIAVIGLMGRKERIHPEVMQKIKIIPPIEIVQREIIALSKNHDMVIILADMNYDPLNELNDLINSLAKTQDKNILLTLYDDSEVKENNRDYLHQQITGNNSFYKITKQHGQQLGIVDINTKTLQSTSSIINVGAKVTVKSETPLSKYLLDIDFDFANKYEPTTITENKVFLNGDKKVIRVRETNLGDLIADTLFEETKDWQPDAVLVNAGAIKKSLEKGSLTRRHTLGALPYIDYVSLLSVKGKMIIEMLDNGVSTVSSPKPEGRFLQVSHLKYKFDAEQEKGKRVLEACINNQQIDPEKDYRIVTTNYVVYGGDGFSKEKDESSKDGLSEDLLSKKVSTSEITIENIFTNGLRKDESISTKIDGRITNIGLKKKELREQVDTIIKSSDSNHGKRIQLDELLQQAKGIDSESEKYCQSALERVRNK